MQLIVARWQITIERRAHTPRMIPPDTDLLERHVEQLHQLQAVDRRRDWVQNWLTMHGDPYDLPRD
ncbi:MAG TPA: hypothetical protein VFM49_29600 [Chloroflexia bacterium]|jgi:hypothetical protein|nr:hypothetical protein [Chloroflexia bacterium]